MPDASNFLAKLPAFLFFLLSTALKPCFLRANSELCAQALFRAAVCVFGSGPIVPADVMRSVYLQVFITYFHVSIIYLK